MFDSLLQASSLPNSHPALVHLPIVCLPLAAGFDLLALLHRRASWASPAATAVYGLAGLGAALAVWSGRHAADTLVGVPAEVQPLIGAHSDWAHYVLYGTILLAVLRFVMQLQDSLRDRVSVRGLHLLLAVGTILLMVRTADLGGRLVYGHGVGVTLPPVEEPAAEPLPAAEDPSDSSSALDRLREATDGGVEWSPRQGDLDALETVLTPAEGSSPSVTVVPSQSPQADGLQLAVDGEGTLFLPGTFGDIQMDVGLDLTEFEGTVRLIHHAQGDARGELSISSQGEAVLVDERDGNQKTLDRQPVDLPAEPFVLAVSSSGKHLKGLIDGRMVAHGHIAPGPAGACGLGFEGRGTVRLRHLKIQPLAAH